VAKPRIAIIGAGWAGLTAAWHLSKGGCSITLFEAAHEAGGRARRSPPVDGFSGPLDNGQHLLSGAYTETLTLLQALGVAESSVLKRQRLDLRRVDGRFRLRAPALPAPWHLAIALLRAHGLSWRSRWAAFRLMRDLEACDFKPACATVADLLDSHRQTGELTRLLWEPLCLAALNTPIHQACATLFAAVLRDALAGKARQSDLLLPTVDLGRVLPDPVLLELQRGKHTLRLGTPIRQLEPPSPDGWQLEGQCFEAVVVATGFEPARRLLASLPQAPALPAFEHEPIATLYLRLPPHWRAPQTLLMLVDDPPRRWHGQWLIDRGQLLGPLHAGELAVVISAARPALELGRDALMQAVIDQLKAQLPKLPEPLACRLIVEKRATFRASPGLKRPAVRVGVPGLYLAGDYTDTGYPAVLEGAVRSGRAAAQAVLQDLGQRID
jgi:squalene-associated FAD-dependent desaturase